MVKYWSADDRVRYADTADKNGRLQEIIQNVHKILDWRLDGDEESALVVVDTETSPMIYQTIAGVLSTLGVETTISIIAQQDGQNSEPPAEVGEAAKRSDVIINLGKSALFHSDAMQHAVQDLGAAYLYLADTTENYFTRGAVDADPAKLDEFTRRIADILQSSDRIRVTSPQGTDVEFRVDGSRQSPFVGYPAGETPLCPIEESVDGTVVVDSYMMGVGLVEEPIVWDVEGGRIREICGGREARKLRRFIEKHGDENSRWIAEFAVMTNEMARPNGIYIEHLSVGGGTHFALGNGTSLGGKYDSEIHLDGAQLEPTVTVDGETLVEAGEFAIER
ncbi:MAG: aminopeptidase [Haloarculaceae archaeon]